MVAKSENRSRGVGKIRKGDKSCKRCNRRAKRIGVEISERRVEEATGRREWEGQEKAREGERVEGREVEESKRVKRKSG